MAHAICFLCTFLVFVCHFHYLCLGRDIIKIGEWIHDGEKIVSAGNIFELGFFSPPNSNGRYVGIWYCNSTEVIVWVANREHPISFNGSGTFGIDRENGNLEVSDSSNITKFSTNLADSPKSQIYLRMAKLTDTGNLVLTNDSAVLWESFKHPTDTFLQGMKMDKNMHLTSWTSDEDPAPGNYSFGLDEEVEGAYLITKSGSKPHWKSGLESVNSFIPKQTISISDAMLYLSSTTRKNIPYCGNSTCSKVSYRRLWMRSNGEIQYLSSDFKYKTWSILLTEPQGKCDVYNFCGSPGICKPNSQHLCRCLPGYEATTEEDRKSGDFSRVCKKISSKCNRDNTTLFKPLLVTMVRSNTPSFSIFRNSSIFRNNSSEDDDCRSVCQDNCACQAYSYRSSYNRNPGSSGCWLWFSNLTYIQEGSTSTDGNYTIYIRVDPANISTGYIEQGLNPPPIGNQHRKMKSSTLKGVIIATSVIFAVALVCSIACISYRRVVAKGKDRNINENQAPRLYDNEYLMDQDDQFGEDDKKDIDVPFFELESILAATDNFSQAHKLGQGGFGPVYKGKFPGGEEIAVKRLSSNSGQGLVEFKNEVVLIAKLQHRNLVRLLGYCIKGNERILLYEYMPNKSLDAFIFDEKLRMLLNWETRFDIIVGVARGLLYLHQDSRLRIIHRDMKASNILLDEEMNPKISDFGLARIVGRRETESNTTRVIGT